jgi:hypothetical protein
MLGSRGRQEQYKYRGPIMRIRVTLKDPDTMHDAVDEAVKREPKPTGISKTEWADICKARAERIKASISDKWMDYGEYLVVDFDVDINGAAGDARVVPSA